ncbi:MAG TPA: hypothetical protein VFK07_01045 [Candidatus Paceibacterota bacterium]|nr:hypothetical protein [Candidatus Paceibacterota bacterium]
MEKIPRPEKLEDKKIRRFKTAMGSVYEYLPDGRTQRFKTVENDKKEPMDQIVFIPPWNLVKDGAKQNYPKIFENIDTEGLYEALLLDYVYKNGKTIRVVDETSKELSNNQEIKDAKKVFILCLDKDNQTNSFYLPVSKEPKIGWNTYDTSKYTGEDGKLYRTKHIGNKVTEIEYQ